MLAAHLPLTFDRFLDEVVSRMTPAEILAFKLSESEQERVEELLERNNEGDLTPEERRELQQVVEIERVMALLKAKAAYTISQQ